MMVGVGVCFTWCTSPVYSVHVDPAITVLATTRFGDVVMPVTWTKTYGKGRVFYMYLAHHVPVIKQHEPLTMMTRGMLWAAEGKANAASGNGQSA